MSSSGPVGLLLVMLSHICYKFVTGCSKVKRGHAYVGIQVLLLILVCHCSTLCGWISIVWMKS